MLLTKFSTVYNKNPLESGHRENLPQHNKDHIWQTHSKQPSQWWKMENISSKIRNNTRMSTLAIIIQNSFGSPSHSSPRRKRNKKSQINWKRSKTVTICRWHDTKKILKMPLEPMLLEQINKLSKVVGFKVNTEISCIPIH